MPASAPPPLVRTLATLGLLAAPYLLNDFANIHVHSPVPWLACDYGSRVVSLGCLAWLLRRGDLGWPDLQLRHPGWARLAGVTLVATAVGVLFLLGPGPLVQALWPQTQLGSIPPIGPEWLRCADYIGGLALVALSEEVVFRGLFPRVIVRAGGSPLVALLVSSAVFGLVHWSLGAGVALHAALLGLLFGLCAQVGRSLWPVIVAHYVVDLVAFR
jgi:membrane protease YdiL (CAAX protease family)